MLKRNFETPLETREQEDELILAGYFAVFNQETTLYGNVKEKIAPNAFDKTLDNDIRALINHDTRLVLGRNKSNTLKLSVDGKGLYGEISINRNDTDAMNLYERVKRGDVSQNSFGFNILDEEHVERDGEHIFIIKEIDLHEVSPVTFPAYPTTEISARQAQINDIEKRKLEVTKEEMRKRLKDAETTKVE